MAPNNTHGTVGHSRGQYTDGEDNEIHTNGIESFWSLLKRAYKGTYHYMSPKHLNRYVREFTGRYNASSRAPPGPRQGLGERMNGKVLRYRALLNDAYTRKGQLLA